MRTALPGYPASGSPLLLRARVCSPRAWRAAGWTLLGVAAALLALPGVQAQYPSGMIVSPGPLNSIWIGQDLSCNVSHAEDDFLEFYPPSTMPGDCGTMLLVDNVNLYAPNFLAHGSTATTGSGLTAASPFTFVSQSPVTGDGSPGAPYAMQTVVRAGTLISVTELDEYVVGTELYTTTVTIENQDTIAHSFRLWRAGDCYLGSNDAGYGFLDPPGGQGRVACTKNPNNVPEDRIEMWIPKTQGSKAQHDNFGTIWARIGTDRAAFADTCECTTLLDNGAGLSWDFTVVANGRLSFKHELLFRPGEPEPPVDPPVLEPPVAGIKHGRGNCQEPASWFMDDSSADVVAWSWDFGDGNTSKARNVQHTYAVAGTYFVSLTVRAANGLTATKTVNHVSFSADAPPGCCPPAQVPGPFYRMEGQEVVFTLPEMPWAGAEALAFGGLPPGSVADTQTRTVRWTPGEGQAGIHPIQATASEGPCRYQGWIMVRVDAWSEEIPDIDRDGIADHADNCVGEPNWDQQDGDGDGQGDACDVTPCSAQCPSPAPVGRQGPRPGDTDGDGVSDGRDSCPRRPDPRQRDADGDGVGDVCDGDMDGDGVVEAVGGSTAGFPDNCPAHPNQEQADADGDNIGDACDPCEGPCTSKGVQGQGGGQGKPMTSGPSGAGAQPRPNPAPWPGPAALGLVVAGAALTLLRRRAA